MSNLKKKIVAVVTTLALSVSLVPGLVSGQTVEELQAQIAALLKQIEALQKQLAELQGKAPAGVPAACQGITFERNLTVGMTGNDVKCLQALLNTDPDTKVAETGAGSPGNETTYFGAKTKAAVIKFQEKYAADVLTPIGLTAGTGFVGSKTRAKLNSLLAGAPTEETPPAPVFEPLKVKLAEDTPPAANVQKGTPNNIVLKLVLTGSETETVNITGLTVTNYGTARATSEVANVKLFDENGIQLSTDRPLISNQVSFVFVPALTIAPKGSRTISVAVDIAATSTTEILRTVQLGVASASAIVGATFSGDFPIKGNVFTIVPAGALGSISVSSYGSLPKTNVKIGEKDVVFNRFLVSVGAREGVKLTQVTVENTQTDSPIVDTDITNIRIREVGGSVVAGPVNLVNKKAVLNLATSLSIGLGQSKKFEVIADIVSGNGRKAKLEIKPGKVLGIGETSGVTIVSTGDSKPSAVTIGVGSLTIGQSTSHPTGSAAAFVKSTTSKVLGVFSVKAEGEDILVNTIKVEFATSSEVGGKLTSVGLYDGDALVSDLKDEVAAGTQEFSLNWLIPAGTTKNLSVKAVTSELDTNGGTVTLKWKGADNGYGLASGETISTNDQSPLSAVTIYQSGNIATLTFDTDTTRTPLSQGVLVNLSDVLLGAIKIRVAKEDMKLIGLTLTGQVDDTTSNAVSSIALYDLDGNALTEPVNVNNGTFTFTENDFTTDVNFTKDTYQTILVKGRTVATTSAGYFLKIADNGLTMLGLDSNGTTTVGNVDLATTTQGQFTITDKILEVKKDPTSPAGDRARDSAMVAAIWEISNPTDSELTISTITLTSKTGLPTGATTTNFKLYDETGTQVLTTVTVYVTNSKVTFGGGSVTVPAKSSKTLTLKIDTTNTDNWPAGTSMHWTIAAANDVTITGGGLVGFGGTVWSIPADTNLIRIP